MTNSINYLFIYLFNYTTKIILNINVDISTYKCHHLPETIRALLGPTVCICPIFVNY